MMRSAPEITPYDVACRASYVSNTSNNDSYQGIDQIQFFSDVKAYLERRIIQDTKGGSNSRQVDEKLDECLMEQVQFYEQMLAENKNGQNVIHGKSADFLEHCIKGLMPIIRISDSKFLFGTTVRTVQIRAERDTGLKAVQKLLVQVGGGCVPLADHWRATAVSETIKLNKLIASSSSSKASVTKVMRTILDKNQVAQSV